MRDDKHFEASHGPATSQRAEQPLPLRRWISTNGSFPEFTLARPPGTDGAIGSLGISCCGPHGLLEGQLTKSTFHHNRWVEQFLVASAVVGRMSVSLQLGHPCSDGKDFPVSCGLDRRMLIRIDFLGPNTIISGSAIQEALRPISGLAIQEPPRLIFLPVVVASRSTCLHHLRRIRSRAMRRKISACLGLTLSTRFRCRYGACPLLPASLPSAFIPLQLHWNVQE